MEFPWCVDYINWNSQIWEAIIIAQLRSTCVIVQYICDILNSWNEISSLSFYQAKQHLREIIFVKNMYVFESNSF